MSFPPHCGPALDTLPPVTAEEVSRVLKSSHAKTSTMDIIPTSLVIRCTTVFSEIIAHLANLSFSSDQAITGRIDMNESDIQQSDTTMSSTLDPRGQDLQNVTDQEVTSRLLRDIITSHVRCLCY